MERVSVANSVYRKVASHLQATPLEVLTDRSRSLERPRRIQAGLCHPHTPLDPCSEPPQ